MRECDKIGEENNLNIDIEFANISEIKEKTEDKKIYIYPVKIIPTFAKIKAVKKAPEEKKKKWNKESLEAEYHNWLANVPKEYKYDILDLLMQYSSILLHDLSDLKHGIIDYELRGNIPENIFMACHYKSPSVIMMNLYARMQTYMVRVGLSEPCSFPKAIHPFSILPKKNAKYPTNQASLDQMDDKYLTKDYRIIQDCSGLTKHCRNLSQGYVCPISECINEVRETALITIMDLNNSFFQLNLSEKTDKQYLRSKKLVQGFSNFLDIASTVFKAIEEPINAIPLNCSVSEYKEMIKDFDKGELISNTDPLYTGQLHSYLDDSILQSPGIYQELQSYKLKLHSFFKQPRKQMDYLVYLHLNVIAKVMTNLEKHNLLITPSKLAILTQESFTFLGYKFIRKNGRLSVTMPEKKIRALLDFPPCDSVLACQEFIGFCGFFSILLEGSKILLGPILTLVRKETKFHWGEEQQKCFKMIKEKLISSTLEGYCRLTDSNKFYELHIYTDYAKLTSTNIPTAAACVYIKDYDDKTLKLGMFWSRLLSPTFMNKPPWVNELSAIALFLVSNKAILAGRCLNLYCDNLVCVYVLKKGLANIDSITDGIVQCLIISISGIDFCIQYTPKSNNPADYISRYSGDRAELPDERCIESTCISDLTLLDSKTFKPCADLESYMKKNHESVNKMKEAAVSHWDINLTKKRFKDTQVFSDSTYQNDDIIALCRNECIPDILNVEE